ncbi:MAG: hypothetical protein AB7S56_02295 [Halothiobacillaceae bacterium]
MDNRDQLIIQSHFALVWWAESLLSSHFQTPTFQQMKFTDTFVQHRLAQPGEAAASLIAPSLYVSLVLPRETIFDQYKDDFRRIDALIEKTAVPLENSYPKTDMIQYTRHLRNATAHARIAITKTGIEFEDKDPKNGFYLRAAIDFLTLGETVQELQLLLRKHVISLQQAGV